MGFVLQNDYTQVFDKNNDGRIVETENIVSEFFDEFEVEYNYIEVEDGSPRDIPKSDYDNPKELISDKEEDLEEIYLNAKIDDSNIEFDMMLVEDKLENDEEPKTQNYTRIRGSTPINQPISNKINNIREEERHELARYIENTFIQ